MTRTPAERVGAGVAAVVLAAFLVVAIGDGGELGGLVVLLGWAGLAATAVGAVAAVPQLGVLAAGMLGAAFCATRFEEAGTLDARVVPLAAALLLLAELVGWSAEAQTSAPPGVPATTRLLVLVLTVAAAGGATALVAAVVTAPVADDLAWAALGCAGLALVTVLGVGLARAVSTRARGGYAGPS